LRVSPGMTNAQTCHSQIGADTSRPIENAIRMCRSNPLETVVKFSAV